MAESPCCGRLTKPEDAAAIARTSIYSLWKPIIHQDIEVMELFSTISTFSLCVNDSQSKRLSATSLHPGTGTIKFRRGDLALAKAGAQQKPVAQNMVSWDARAAQGNRYFYLYPAYLKNQSDGHWPRRRIHVSTPFPTLTSYNWGYGHRSPSQKSAARLPLLPRASGPCATR
jgi:hypothetical protein